MTIVIPAPVATPKKTDPTRGFAILEQPIALAAQPPVIDGVAWNQPLSPADPALVLAKDVLAKKTFSYGALLYRIVPPTNAVQIYNGANWIDEASFDPSDPHVAASELAFDTKSNTFTGIFVPSSAGTALVPPDPVVDTALGGRPAYGFLTIFRTPRKPNATGTPFDAAVRSARAGAFGVISSAASAPVSAGPVHALVPVKDMANANGFAILVKDGSGVLAAEAIVSADTSLPALVALQLYAGGVARASVAIDAGGVVTVRSASTVTIDAPVVNVTGELRAHSVRYRPFGGGPEQYL